MNAIEPAQANKANANLKGRDNRRVRNKNPRRCDRGDYKAAIKASEQKEVQHELARLARILRYLYDDPDWGAMACAEIAAKGLFQEPPQLVLCQY